MRENFNDLHIDKIIQYHGIFNSYDFSTVVLRREDIDSAIEVFTRINTGGKTLTLFEIMSAKTYDEEQNFDMQSKFQEFLKELGDANYETISSSVILNVLSLILSENRECNRKISAELRPELCRYLCEKENPIGDKLRYLREFFWRISLSHRYSSATETKLAQDFKRIDKIRSGLRPKYDDIKVFLNSKQDLIDTNFSVSNSFCKATLCLLASNEPKDFRTNGTVFLDNSNLKVANSKNYHHFFQKHFYKEMVFQIGIVSSI